MADSRPSRDTDHWPQIVAKVALPGRAPQEDPGIRFHLWVDAVGGFLCALADEVWLGQAAPGNAIAVPLQAELSRRHAKLRRSGGAYVLEPAHPVSVNGRSSEDKRLLADGDELELGSGVRLRFRQPHPLSATARLEPISRHRLGSGLDAVLLLAESCVMGPNWQNHVVCRDWAGDVVLFRHQERLFCRAREQILIDGVSYEGKGPLTPHSQVAGSDFTFSIELIR